MSLEVASLGSGSKGNATLVRSRSTTLMIDCGYNRKTALARAEAIGLSLSDLDAILVTHEHSDHIGGVSTLARSLDIPVYTTVGTWHAKSQHADLGSISPHVREVMSDLDGLLIEFNHCSERLRFGPYPPRLKQRVGSDYGHLNNHQALEFVRQLNLQRLQLLIAAHISEQNNCPKLVDELLTPYREQVSTLMIAEQAKGYNWIPVIPD